MNSNKWIFFILGLLIGVVGMLIIGSRNPSARSGSMMGINPSSDILDAHFIEQMIPHHEDAITMAELADTKAQRPEIKQLAKNIIESQSGEIEQMKTWYKDWFGKEVPAGDQAMNQHGMMGTNNMHMGMMGDASDTTTLEQAEDFDIAFIEHMISHHQMAVMMAEMLRNGSDRPEMNTLAEAIIAAQNKEIDQMRQWLKDWSN